MEVHKKYNLRSRKTPDTPNKKPSDTPAKKNIEILVTRNTEVPTQKRLDTIVKPNQTNDPSTS
ncbi:hypothetical protein, partial [Actinobacillus pleuropneumoniae]